ncbi:MAG: UvrD-helicase domain-containing protein [Proteobacteria bacterium]|nr:UvrD-helicase domain-containing protein [Pseudomonadota bacterium]
MAEVEVAVFRAGREVDRIVRPLRELDGRPAVTYRRQLWPLLPNREIHLDGVDPRRPFPAPGSATRVAHGDRKAEQRMAGGPVAAGEAQVDDGEERAAIRSAAPDARILVQAGPGTGKTEIAARRIAALIGSRLSPGQLLVLSFSRSAVRTLTRRLSRLQNCDEHVVEELRHVAIRTFDSWAFRILRLLGRPPAELMSRSYDDNIAELTSLIRGERREEVRARIGERRHIIVDEFQDLPGVRAELVMALLDLLAPPAKSGCGFTVLGDPTQAIFGFTSKGKVFPKAAEYWKRMINAYGENITVRTLHKNYRAESDIAALSARLRSLLLSDSDEGEKLKVIREAIDALPPPQEPVGPGLLADDGPRSHAILTRTNGEALRVLQELFGSDAAAPARSVKLHAGSHVSLPPAWIGALLQRLQPSELPRSQFGRIYAHLGKEWDELTKERLGLPDENTAWTRLAVASGKAGDSPALNIADLRSRLGWPDAFPDDQALSDEGIVITTIHRSKGMEFDVVTILDASPDDDEQQANSNWSMAEEASVGYVGMTRAARDLNRLDADEIYKPPTSRSFRDERERLCHWGKWINLEMGLRGDIDPYGFVDPALHGGAAGVKDLQDYLLKNARRLEGQKVMLQRHFLAEGKAVWNIHIQEGSTPGRVIGRTGQQLTLDLLSLLHKKGYSLPRTILNLRIAGVGTVTAEGEFPLEDPHRTSRIWLGVSLFGTGDFKPHKGRNG